MPLRSVLSRQRPKPRSAQPHRHNRQPQAVPKASCRISVNGSDAMAVQEVGQPVERLTRGGVVPFFRDKAMRHLAPLPLPQRIDELIRHSGLASARHARFPIKTWTHEFESAPDSQPWTVFESLFCHMKKHQEFYEVLHATGRDNVLRTSLREKKRVDARTRERGSLPESVFRRRNQRMDRGTDRTRHARNTRRAERITETLC